MPAPPGTSRVCASGASAKEWSGTRVRSTQGSPAAGGANCTQLKHAFRRDDLSGTTDAFLEHYGLASLADLPGMAEMKAAGLLSLDLPPDFEVPNPEAPVLDEDPIEAEAPQFHVDFIGEDN